MLSNERLEELVIKANAEGKEPIEVMTRDEILSYKENVLTAIERQKERLATQKAGTIANIIRETIGELEDILAKITKIEEEEDERPRFSRSQKTIVYKGIEVTVRHNVYEGELTLMAESEGAYTWTKTDTEEQLLKTHYRKVQKKMKK